MNHFAYRGGVLHAEDCSLVEVAERFGTPTYVYSSATLTRHFEVFDRAFAPADHLVCFAVKALSNLAVLKLLADLGSGFDIVSGGELNRVLVAGGSPEKTVFSGVGKTEAEMTFALDVGIASFHVESAEELDLLERVAKRMGRPAPISLRVNPDVDAKTHPYISTGLRSNKFGIPSGAALSLYEQAQASPHLTIEGVTCHIGSQITDLAPFVSALDHLMALVDQLRGMGIPIETLDLGGGLGIPYKGETGLPSPDAYGAAILDRLAGRPIRLLLEPGRVIVGNAGVLLTRVLYRKEHEGKRFVIVDAGMNDAIRPALYQGWHAIQPVVEPAADRPTVVADVVGPVCESADFLARDRELVLPEQGDLLAMMTAGAYGMVMASNYNSRPRGPEILVEGTNARLVRRRETWEDLVRLER